MLIRAAIIALLLCLVPLPVSAHELAQNNGVSAVLHIPPDDNPRSGQTTVLSVEFSSVRPGFDVGYCQCVASVQTSPDKLTTVSLASANGSSDSGQASLVFPKPGVYDLTIRGLASSRQDDHFSIHYQLRVTPPDVSSGSVAAGRQVLLLSLTGVILLGISARSFISRGQRYKR